MDLGTPQKYIAPFPRLYSKVQALGKARFMTKNMMAILALTFLIAQLVRWHSVGFRVVGL